MTLLPLSQRFPLAVRIAEGIANVLVEEGIPKADIVLAFHAPEMRPYTDFAAA